MSTEASHNAGIGDWVPFYTEFADKLLQFRNARGDLLVLIEDVYKSIGMKVPKLDADEPSDIDPFSVYGLFNKHIAIESRQKIIGEFRKRLGIKANVPMAFDGTPSLSNMAALFYGFGVDRQPDDIENIWSLFEHALDYADDPTAQKEKDFCGAFDVVRNQFKIGWNLTMGLFWMRPTSFVNLDNPSREFIIEYKGLGEECARTVKNLKGKVPAGKDYLDLCRLFKRHLNEDELGYKDFPGLSVAARVAHKAPTQVTPPVGGGTGNEPIIPPYGKDDFLAEAFLSGQEYDKLASLLRVKRNVILQGAPGVGKTFVAKRLAYSMMGEKAAERVKLVQFHQSYSYEDFIMGYRPCQAGFELKTGAFYDFCKKAEGDSENDYFFIIDEINRGNLSKIFGELFMLLEADKRGESTKLLYSDEQFSVPKNLYMIGTMNTADRSLAMLDYALRRQFAFYEIGPAFASDGFRAYQASLKSEKLDRLVQCIELLNEAIESDDSLGRGFRIGHSYLCNMDAATPERLEQVVDFEIVPLLEEYWFDEPGKVRDWKSRLKAAIG